MSPRNKAILISAVCGGVIGALATRFRLHGAPRIPALTPDHALLEHLPFFVLAGVGWVLFSLYWEIAAKNAAESKSAESPASRAVHVTLANLALLFAIAPIHGLGRFLPVSPLIMTAGLLVEASGLLLAIWARRHLGRNWSGEITIKVEHELIRSGPYKRLRHPIYTGLLAMYAGTAIVSGEWLAVVGFALALFAYWRKIRLGEANLNVAFGPEFRGRLNRDGLFH
jgi:protein-S-isoprenylcysteine O-methyltransferase Ste14